MFNIELILPISVAVILAYLASVYNQSKSYSRVVLVHAALKWFHAFAPMDVTNPLDSPVCKNFVESTKRNKPPIKKKIPISPEFVKQVISKYGGPSATLLDLRLACFCTLGFVGFFRYDELSRMLVNHLTFFHDHLRIFVPSAKNDIYREGNYVYIKKLNNNYCPVALLERYLDIGGVERNSNVPLFRKIRYFKSTNQYKFWGDKLSYTRGLELFKNCLKDLGYNEKDYGLHSLRAGGATAAARNNTELSERVLKLHGRWKSDTAKDMYILEDVNQRLKISSNLGI